MKKRAISHVTAPRKIVAIGSVDREDLDLALAVDPMIAEIVVVTVKVAVVIEIAATVAVTAMEIVTTAV